jgi:hypothetical protein
LLELGRQIEVAPPQPVHPADTTVTNQFARLKLSLQARLRVASRLQCSVART